MSEEKLLSWQLTECLEFLIWLKKYNRVDGLIKKRIVDLLQKLEDGP